MRDILFRGKHILAGPLETIWVYGSLVTHPNNYAEIYTVDNRVLPIIPETIGQYTGLRDKNGVPIFEGDILYDPRWVVTYCADTHESLGMNAGWYIQRDNFESWMELENKPYYEVIGNIHDNPDLLNK